MTATVAETERMPVDEHTTRVVEKGLTTQPALSVLAAQARLELPEARFAEIGALLDVLNDVMQALETLDLDDAQPARSFDARWE